MLIYQFLEQPLADSPDKPAVICGNRQCTYRELVDTMNHWANALFSLGIKRGDRVALFMKNRVELVQLYYACFRIGAVAVPLNTRYQSPEAGYALEQSGSKVLISSLELLDVVKDICHTLPQLDQIFLIDEDPGQPLLSWPLFARGVIDQQSLPEPELRDPAIIIYTSGSTGRPKGAVHTHYSMYHHILNKTRSLEIQSDEVSLAGTQICHIAGYAGLMLPTLANGGTLVMIGDFEPGSYINLLKTHHPTNLILLPTELLEVLEHPDAGAADFSCIRTMLVAGDKVSHHIYELFRNLSGFDLMEGCGMTECEGYSMQPRHEPKKPGSIGKPISGVELRLVDPEFQDVPDGQPGEILIRAQSVIKEYWSNPEETARSFVDGWFRTGDVAFRDPDGYYHFVTRIKELIIRGGSNITPGEVEDVLEDHPDVALCGVVGFPDDHFGQIVGAFIVTKPGHPVPSPDDLTTFAASRIAGYKIPERWIFTDHLPINPVGKIDRKKLHELSGQYQESTG